MLLIGPTLLAGIGQMLFKYCDVFKDAKYYTIDSRDIPDDEEGIIFALPLTQYLQRIPEYKKKLKKLH